MNWFEYSISLINGLPSWLGSGLFVFLLLFIWWMAYRLCDFILVKQGTKLVNKSKNKFDDFLAEKKVLHRLAHLPAFFIVKLAFSALVKEDGFSFVEVGLNIYFILLIVGIIFAFLEALNQGQIRRHLEKIIPLKACIQVIKIIVAIIAAILLFAELSNESPKGVLVGMGALTAVILLIFKDAILGFVAGIQLAANNLVKEGDWIEVPSLGVDGEVMDVALTTVKVRNWDKTITSLPTYSLISNGVKNWKGMSESKMRRIKRSLYIDMTSVKFLNQTQLERLEKLPILQEYFTAKKTELNEWNSKSNIADDPIVKRQLTNLGTFRKYLKFYLKNHPLISQEATLIVRQLQPGSQGLPLEIYAFSKQYAWADYEDVQSDIFDHALAVLKEFDLQIFQEPTGLDFKSFANKP